MVFPSVLTLLIPWGLASAKSPPSSSPAATAAMIGREAIGVLAARANDPDPEVRALVAAAWGRLANRAALPLLKKSVRDEKADVRIASAVSLIQFRDEEGLTRLIDESKGTESSAASPAEEVRRMARDAARARAIAKLGDVGGPIVIEALNAALGDASGEVRDSAAVALARLGHGSSRQFIDAMGDPDEGVRSSAARSLGLIGRDGLEPLKKALAGDPSVNVRAEAAGALGAFSDAASLALLVSGLGDKSGRVRTACVRALSRRDEAISTAALKKLLDQAPPPEVALVAAGALARRRERADLSLIELTLAQRDPELKLLAVDVLTRTTVAEAEQLLLKAMRNDDDGRVRAAAAEGLVERLRGMSNGGSP